MCGGPIRTCIGCGRKAQVHTLIRVVNKDGVVVIDSDRCLPGRGAWMHRTELCITKALRSRRLLWALRSDVLERERALSDALELSGLTG